ncbi:RnfABCDGE type electron transport complex subunit D [Salinispira pacifica]
MSSPLDRFRPAFEPGGRFEKFSPVFHALDNLLFAAGVEPENPPYGRDPLDVKRIMILVVVALIPPFIASVYFFGWRILLTLLVSYAAGGAVEVIFAILRKKEISEGFLVTGFLFPLIVPPGLPLWIVAVGVAFGVLVGKEVFGGTGRNLFNPALVGRVFVALAYPSAMTGHWLQPAAGGLGRIVPGAAAQAADTVSSATPLVLAKGGTLASPLDLFLGNVPGSAGETSALAILIGGLFLVAVGIANWRTVVSVIGTFGILSALLHLAVPGTVEPAWFNLLSGGFLFGAFFMCTDPVTGPVTQSGKWVYGFLIALVTLLIRSFSGFVEGMMFAILFGNICSPLIDEVIIRSRMRRYAHEQ